MKFIKNILMVVIAFIIAINIHTYSHSNTLKFAQLSDVHYTTVREDTTFKMLSKSKDLFEDAIFQVNTTPNLDFVMITGDLVDAPKVEHLEEVMPIVNTITRPWYMSFGNHDIAISGKLTKEKYLSILRENNPNFVFDNSYYSFSPKKGFKAIVLDPIIDDRVTGNGFLPPKEIQWLKNELSASENEVIMIFMHNPVKEPFKSSGHRLTNAQELIDILKAQNKPIAVFTGHYHATKVFQDEKILYVCSPSLVTYPNAFRIIEVKNDKDKVSFELIFKETGRKDIQSTAKLKLFASQTYSGGEKDQNYTYILNK